MKIFKEIGFKFDIKRNLEIVDFLDITFNLVNSSHKPDKKSNDVLLYINKNSNHHHRSEKNYQKLLTTN